jgi:alkanesulfonate monooxygenase SsuD/methylene tetrahydromethanopterin reductase-like flavin-dependent oxidoreductase (luciferase family)
LPTPEYRQGPPQQITNGDEEMQMEIGIGLPATIPGVTGEALLDWARRADRAGFSSLGTIDRIIYPNYEPLIALTAAAAVTDRIRLTTAILIAPLRANTALLAKQCATIHHLSGGRLVLGLAPGSREDDFDVSGVDHSRRGRIFDRQLDELRDIWAGKEKGFAGPIGPPLDEPPRVLIGGGVDASFRRAAQHDGWMMGGGPPDRFRETLAAVREAWAAAGRDGEPRTAALAYFALGGDADRHADAYLRDYYAWLGEEIAGRIRQGAATDEESVRNAVTAFDEAGCDELILFPCSSDPEQVDLLAEVVGL